MAYDSVIFIAHCIFTGFTPEGDKQKYVGLPKPVDDMNARVEFVSGVIDLAFRSVNNTSPTVLKVMVFPELLFLGPQGAYSQSIVGDLKDRLAEMTSEAKWADWLFVFGTVNVLGSETPPATYATVSFVRAGNNADIVPLQKITDSKQIIAAAKLEGGGYSGALTLVNDVGSDVDKQSRNHRFSMGQIRFGLEICADHGKKLLASSGPDLVDIQIVPSAGMTIVRDYVRVRPDGFAFNCDGTKPPMGLNKTGITTSDTVSGGVEFNPYSALFRVGRGPAPAPGAPPPVNNPLNIVLQPIAGVQEIGLDSLDGKFGALYSGGFGRLHVYPVQTL